MLGWTESWVHDISIAIMNIFWKNADVATPTDIFYNCSVQVINGKMTVKANYDGSTIAEETITGWAKSGNARLYWVTLENGEIWDVVKLKCNCLEPEKSGRIW